MKSVAQNLAAILSLLLLGVEEADARVVILRRYGGYYGGGRIYYRRHSTIGSIIGWIIFLCCVLCIVGMFRRNQGEVVEVHEVHEVPDDRFHRAPGGPSGPPRAYPPGMGPGQAPPQYPPGQGPTPG